ncbi:F-box domain-containing protein [Mycena sanguinolenta]|uniref:F-box domain-containing protein n=1 Tax=Mycena sanguinolenta TaxID=230812 RepID=A0A8H6YEX4_9AGAR|nr:F-box domain-containing protein [Mycena sanguinolenta]
MATAPFSIHAILAQQTERTSGSSTAQIKDLIAESDSRVTSIQTEIAALKSQIAALAELSARESAAGEVLRFLIAPIRKLPVELLAQIFVLTIRDSDPSQRWYKQHTVHIRDAYRLSHVCRLWRNIACNLPRLWTGPIEASFSLEFDSAEKEEIYADGLRVWFARSEPLPVPIIITGLREGNWFSKIRPRLTEELRRISPRWRSLEFHEKTPGSLLQQLTSRGLDALEELQLRNVARDVADFDPTTVLSFIKAPRLQRLTIDSACRIPMPWAQLTDITLTHQTSSGVLLDIFSQCTNVVKASVVTAGWSDTSPKMLPLDKLSFLSVFWVESFVVQEMKFLDFISAPVLDELHLSFQVDSRIEWTEGFTAFQLRSPNITRFKVDGRGAYIPPSGLLSALRHTPSLTHLSVEDSPGSIDDAVLNALCYTNGVEPMVPRLHSLGLAAINCSQDLLAHMITSRWWTESTELASCSTPSIVARWRRIQLAEGRDDSGVKLGPNFRDAMEDLRGTGLAVDLMDWRSWRSKGEAW